MSDYPTITPAEQIAAARANRTLAARAAVDLAGDTLTEIYDALRAADGMPTRAQIDAFEEAALDLWKIAAEAIARNEQEQSR